MATKIVLNKKKASDEFGIIGIQSFNNGKKKKSLGIRMTVLHFKEHFNEDFQLFRPTPAFDYQTINTKINEGVYRFENNIPDKVKVELKTKPQQSETHTIRLSYMDYFKLRISLKKTESHKYAMLNVYRKLEKYLKHLSKEDLFFDEINSDFWERFKLYCLTVPDPRKLKEGGVKNYFVALKSIINDAHKTGYYVYTINPFANLKLDKAKRNEKSPLNINQVKALLELDLENKYSLTRQMFYFQILANGMRCSDLMFIRYADFKHDRLIYEMMKTGSKLKIKVGIKIMMLLAEQLGEIEVYNKYIDEVKIYDKSIGASLTIEELNTRISEHCPQTAFVEGEDKESYKGYVVKKGDHIAMNLIDFRIELATDINNLFVDYMKEVVAKQNPNDFVFLNAFSRKAAIYFKDYKKGDLFTFDQLQKYKALRNLYNNRLGVINEIYNSKIPLKTKDRDNYLIHLSSHVARNTFVNILLNEKVDVYIISKSLAHTEVKTTDNYINTRFKVKAVDTGTDVIQSVI